MSPEEIETHGKVKQAVALTIDHLSEELDLGEFLPDGTWLTNDAADLSCEPDGTFISWESSASGRVCFVPRQQEERQYIEIQGSPDWVLEVVSNSSGAKDTRILRRKYQRARITEYWLVDARGADVSMKVLIHRPKGYVESKPREGWLYSPLFERSFRLVRRRNRMGRWQYKLEVRSEH